MRTFDKNIAIFVRTMKIEYVVTLALELVTPEWETGQISHKYLSRQDHRSLLSTRPYLLIYLLVGHALVYSV